jgi:hypothetical protein
VSAIHTIAIAASTSHGERACNSTTATNAPHSATKPASMRTQRAAGCQSQSTDGIPIASQKRVAAPHAMATVGGDQPSPATGVARSSSTLPVNASAAANATWPPVASPRSLAHSRAPTVTVTSTATPNPAGGRRNNAADTATSRIAAVTTRVASADMRAWPRCASPPVQGPCKRRSRMHCIARRR